MPALDTPELSPFDQETTVPTAEFGTIEHRLIPYLRQGLGLDSGGLLEPLGPEWDRLCEVMIRHRIGGLIWPVMVANGTVMPAQVLEWFANWRDVTSRLNGANLLTMRRVLPRLKTAGIPTLAFKGPVLQQMAYGSVFHRPSTDLDLLVAFSDFDRAGRVLSDMGYTLAPVCQSLWWKLGLGEQHFGSTDAASITLDLHHRVQQPGCPLPLHPERFFQQCHAVSTAGQDVPTLSYVHSTLLTAMSYAKAIHHREPALRYLLDMVALVRGQSQVPWRDVTSEAALQGLTNTLGLAVRGAAVILGPGALPVADRAASLGQVSDETLWKMTFSPDDQTIQWPRRRELLFALFDRKSHYVGGLVAMVGSDFLRRAATSPRVDHRVLGATS